MPPPPPSPTKEPKTEAEKLMFKADQVTDQSLDSTRRMANLCNEAKEAGIRTLVALDDQGEKLDNIESGMGAIDKDMKEAEKSMKGMGGGFFSFIPNPFAKKDKRPAAAELKGKEAATGGGERPVGLSDAGIPMYGGFVSKYTNDAREDEMEKNLVDVSNMIGNLKNVAIDMGGQISSQNAQIDHINYMAEQNQGRISTANEKATKLLK